MSALPQPLKRVLIINIFGIGDVLFTTPLIRNLKSSFPDIFIGYLCNQRARPVLENNPHVDKIFVYERDDFKKIYDQSRILYLKKLNAFMKDIRREGFEVVLDVSLNSFTGFLAWWAGIKHRVGFDYKNRGFFLNHKIFLKGYEEKHVVEYYLKLLEEVDVPVVSKTLEFHVRREDAEWAGHFLKSQGVSPDSLLIGLVPGGGASWGKDAFYKRWPAEKYAKLADKLFEKYSADIILLGDSKELGVSAEVARLMRHPAVLATGLTTIGQFAALTQKCSFNILNDGGPLHVAVAAGAKTVSIFGPVDERVYGPYPRSDHHKVVTKQLACRPCYRRFRRASCDHISCLHQITVDDVLQEAAEII
ncbi:MAG TPA: lipopolysaccharide heptosyltransferase II [Candidatus Omnitrophica bacterium]|nr:MAG: lipopolysaccharide heptosyltransferase II [Omnitrophica WOR_2 bacterium GWA2_45_18]HBR14482.1 lipopolysaccharide heptosyltransferase II [Candidatus Omnitrophota bacterium]